MTTKEEQKLLAQELDDLVIELSSGTIHEVPIDYVSSIEITKHNGKQYVLYDDVAIYFLEHFDFSRGIREFHELVIQLDIHAIKSVIRNSMRKIFND